MLTIIRAEFLKIKKNKLPLLSTFIVLSLPILLIFKDLLIEPTPSYTEWRIVINGLNSIILPIMSGFFITFLIQKEYQDGTLINVLTAPVSRMSFVLAKLVIWFVWYAITLLLVEVVTIIGFAVLFPNAFTFSEVGMTMLMLTKSGGFSFVASTPILWVAIKQKSLFYPTMLTALLFTVIQMSGTQASPEMILLASIVPWSAVSIASLIDTSSLYFFIALLSIMISGILGVYLAVRLFLKQDQ